jgi:hypothetical protein
MRAGVGKRKPPGWDSVPGPPRGCKFGGPAPAHDGWRAGENSRSVAGPMVRAAPAPVPARAGLARLLPGRVLWTAACALVLAVRFHDLLARPRLWAEDGQVFFHDAESRGVAALFTPYAGYLHALPRLVALAGAHVPAAWIPGLYVGLAFAVTLLVAACILSPRLDLPGKPLLALAVVAAPCTGEVFLTPTNLQWITAFALLATCLKRDPAGAAQWAADLLVLVVAGLTGPFSVLLVPCFLLRLVLRRTAASGMLLVLIGAVAAVQGYEIMMHPVHVPGLPGGPLQAGGLLAVLSARAPLALVGSSMWASYAGRPAVMALGACAFLGIAALAVTGCRRPAAVAQVAIFAALVVAADIMKTRLDSWNYADSVIADRYLFIPRVLCLWLVVLGLGKGARAAKIAAAAAALSVAATDVLNPMSPRERPYFPWAPYCRQITIGQEVDIVVSPGWTFTLPERRAGGP